MFGLGANMVKALRYWPWAVGLTEEPVQEGESNLCKLVCVKHDRYTEELGTLFLLQYKLAQTEEGYRWYFFSTSLIFGVSKDDFVDSLQKIYTNV